MVPAKVPNGETVFWRALLDSGSQVSFITKDLARKLQLDTEPRDISLGGTGDHTANHKSEVVQTILKTAKTAVRVEALTLNTLTGDLPSQPIEYRKLQIS